MTDRSVKRHDCGNNAVDLLSGYDAHGFLWHRPGVNERCFSDVTTVLGHTPVWYYGRKDGRMLRTETWIDIDTGASNGGKPMLLRLDDLKEFYCD